MNYEEKLNAQDGAATHREELPMGVFYKKLIGQKYRNVLELKPTLMDSIVFCEGLKKEHEQLKEFSDGCQLQYELHSDSSGVYELEVEQGNYLTFAQLIQTTPAVLAIPNFADRVVKSLLEVTVKLNEQGIFHLCYAPQNVFARKSDNQPMLLCHGSSFAAMNNMNNLFGDFENFVAPEVLSREGMDERSDVYSLGRFIEWLFQQGDMPLEYERLVAKATQENPAERFASASDMLQALRRFRGVKQSVLTFAAAVAIALLVVGLYFEMMPQTENIEFVEGVQKEPIEDLLDGGFDPETELGLWGNSEADTLTPEERTQMENYQKKAEEIFRKQFSKEADRVISKMYSKDRMSLSEATFVASNNAMAKELLKLQGDMAAQTGVPESKANSIAAEIIESLTAEKRKSIVKYGVQK